MFDFEKHKSEFEKYGATVLQNALPVASVTEVYNTLLAVQPTGSVDVDLEPDPETLTEGGITRYDYFDYAGLNTHTPIVKGWYEAILPVIRAVTGLDVILSPYSDSAVIALVYRENGGQQEFHLDTNPITVLLYLNDLDCGATRVYRRGEATYRDIYPKAGNILLMMGRELRHAGMEVTHGTKIVMPMNMYLPTDLWRPEALIKSSYWEDRKPRKTKAQTQAVAELA